jgi:aryl-alcohol dehydrogenase-like predicted oxidoreductase
MKIKSMGKTGLKVSEICLGTMTFGHQSDDATSLRILDIAADAGINCIDTADVYPFPPTFERAGSTEMIIGRWLKGKRDRFVLATKCGIPMSEDPNCRGLSRKHIFRSVDESLRRLQTDYIDLYYMHQPDLETPIEETLRALNDLVRAGRVRYIGCSNFTAWQIAKSLWTADQMNLYAFAAIQPRYNLLYREIENEILPLSQDQGLGVFAYNPLSGGFLTGKYQRGEEPDRHSRFGLVPDSKSLYRERYWQSHHFDAVDRMKQFFKSRGKELIHVALAWVLGQPGITSAILGASRPDQLKHGLAGTGLVLEEEERIFCNDLWFSLPRVKDPKYSLR